MNVVQSPTTLILFCLIPILLFSLLVAWRGRDIKAGINLFFLFSLPLTILLTLSWFFKSFFSEKMLDTIFTLFFYVVIFVLGGLGLNYWNKTLQAGRLLYFDDNLPKNFRLIFGGIFILLAVLSFFTLKDKSTTVFPICMAYVLLTKLFSSFKIYEFGIFVNGKFYKTNDIDSMKWSNQKQKESVDISLAKTKKIKRIKIPWKLTNSVDDYIRLHFPFPRT